MKIKNLLLGIVLLGLVGVFTNVNAQSTLEIFQLSAEPTVDAELDDVWEAMPVHNVNQLEAGGTRTGDADYDVTFRVGWINNKLFFFFDIKDDVHIFTPGANAWFQDYVIVFMNFSATHATDEAYSGTIPAWWYRTTIPTEGGEPGGGGRGPIGWLGLDDFPAYEFATKVVTGGYNIEFMFDLNDGDWENPAPLAEDVTFGFDVEAGDLDIVATQGSDRKYQLFWSETGTDGNWNNPIGLGTAVIREEILWGGDVSVNETAMRSVKMFPNPASDVVSFENIDQVKRIQITSLTGQIVRDVNASVISSIDISGITKGIYLVVFEGDNSKSAKKLIIK